LVFLAGVGLLFYGWHKAHNAVVNVMNPASPNTANSSEMLVVIGGFVILMAFVPSSQTLGRWMSLKKQKRPQAAHFKRRRQRG
jgi:hypothetical protein